MTKIPQEIIAKAIEGGWWPDTPHKVNKEHTRLVFNELEDSIEFHPQDKEFPYSVILWEQIALDKDFWVALGKSLNWEHEHMRVNWGQEEHYYVPLWQFYASKVINLILQEKETDSFWQNLLNV